MLFSRISRWSSILVSTIKKHLIALLIAVAAGIFLLFFEQYQKSPDYAKMLDLSSEWAYDSPIRWTGTNPFESPNGLRMEHSYSIQYYGGGSRRFGISGLNCSNDERILIGKPEKISLWRDWREVRLDQPDNVFRGNQGFLLNEGNFSLIKVQFYISMFDKKLSAIPYLDALAAAENDEERGKYVGNLIPYSKYPILECGLVFNIDEQKMTWMFRKIQMHVGGKILLPSLDNDFEEMNRRMQHPFD